MVNYKYHLSLSNHCRNESTCYWVSAWLRRYLTALMTCITSSSHEMRLSNCNCLSTWLCRLEGGHFKNSNLSCIFACLRLCLIIWRNIEVPVLAVNRFNVKSFSRTTSTVEGHTEMERAISQSPKISCHGRFVPFLY